MNKAKIYPLILTVPILISGCKSQRDLDAELANGLIYQEQQMEASIKVESESNGNVKNNTSLSAENDQTKLKRIGAYQGKLYGNDTIGYIHFEGDWVVDLNYSDNENSNTIDPEINDDNDDMDNSVENQDNNMEENDQNIENTDENDENIDDKNIKIEDPSPTPEIDLSDKSNNYINNNMIDDNLEKLIFLCKDHPSYSIVMERVENPYDFMENKQNVSFNDVIISEDAENDDENIAINDQEKSDDDAENTEEIKNDEEMVDSDENLDEDNGNSNDDVENLGEFSCYADKYLNDLSIALNKSKDQAIVYKTIYGRNLNEIINLKNMGSQENLDKANEILKKNNIFLNSNEKTALVTKIELGNSISYIYEMNDGYAYIIQISSTLVSTIVEELDKIIIQSSYNKLIGYVDPDDEMDKFFNCLADIIAINPKSFGIDNENPTIEEINSVVNFMEKNKDLIFK